MEGARRAQPASTAGRTATPRGGAARDQDRLQTCNGITYTYDANGTLTARGTDTFTYDVHGSLRSATVNGTLVDHLIDGAGRRVGRWANGQLTRYVYADQLRIAAEIDAAAVVSRFYYGNKVNVPELMVRNNVTYRLLTDHLGSVRQAVNVATGAVVFAATYSPWGERTVTVGSETFVPFGFAGGLYDVTTGLVRFGARDYDPATGRWTAKDPVRFEGGQTNLFVYVANAPTDRVDPLGLWGFTFGGGGGAGLAVGYNAGAGFYVGTEGIGSYSSQSGSVGIGAYSGTGGEVGFYSSLEALGGAGYGVKVEGGMFGQAGATFVGNSSGITFGVSGGFGGGTWLGGVIVQTDLSEPTTWGDLASGLAQDLAELLGARGCD